MKKLTIFLLILLAFNAFPQTFTGPGGPILDDGSDNFYPLTVSGVTPNLIDTAFGLETVCINLTHTWDDDLTISLIAPDGTEFELTSHNGGDGDNYTNTCFNYGSTNQIYLAGAPFTGVFRPEGAMSLINNGQDPNGIWTLHILDTYPFADQGDVIDWSIEFGDDPAVPFPFTAANLPLLVINTNGVVIPVNTKVMAGIRLINNPGQPNHIADSANEFYGQIGIEVRGHSAAGMPKKSFAFEIRHADSSSFNVSLLGMPAESDWVLHASYADKSLLRNFYTFELYRKMGHWAPRMRFCEVVIDGEYQGIYILGEKIKRSSQRVNIHSLSANDTTATTISGGYIFKIDWEDPGDAGWNSVYPAVNGTSGLRYLIVYPKPENINPSQLSWIQSYVDDFEAAMHSPGYADTINGYRQFVNETSFLDFIILNEFTKNVDGYRLSTYLHKDRNGKITAGPPWDYDLSWGNADYMEGYLPTGWDYLIQQNYTNQCPFWWQRFFQDSLFMDQLRCRWEVLRLNIFDPQVMKSELDSLANILSVSTDLNFTKWPILGVYVWPNPAPIPTTYIGEIDKLKDWVDLRVTWLDNHWPGSCSIFTGSESVTATETEFSIYPNPNKGSFHFTISADEQNGRLSIYDVIGNEVYSEQIGSLNNAIQLNARPGTYYLRYISDRKVRSIRLLID